MNTFNYTELSFWIPLIKLHFAHKYRQQSSTEHNIIDIPAN